MRTDHRRHVMYWKVVYYGAGLCGKTTNLIQVEKIVPPTHRSKLTLFETAGERTFALDDLDFNISKKGKYDIRVRLYTVPGQSHYKETRKAVLQDTDAVIFVADSQPEMFDSNIESRNEMIEYLQSYDTDLMKLPFALQLNKRDIPGALPPAQLAAPLMLLGAPPIVEATAVTGFGVMKTLNEILKLSIPKILSQVPEETAEEAAN